MDVTRLQVKVYAAGAAPPFESFVPVFHDWIKHRALRETLVDVASYAHVARGPGVLLVGHAGDYYVEDTDGRVGLCYSRKREPPPPAERLTDAFRRAIHAAILLEKDARLAAGGLRFSGRELLLRLNDRLAAPDAAAAAARRPEIDALAARLLGPGAEVAPAGAPKQQPSFRIVGAADAPLPSLLERLGGPPA